MDDRKIWLVNFPTYQYKEDVKKLASKAGLKIVDARHGRSFKKEMIEDKPPKLTLKNDKTEKTKK